MQVLRQRGKRGDESAGYCLPQRPVQIAPYYATAGHHSLGCSADIDFQPRFFHVTWLSCAGFLDDTIRPSATTRNSALPFLGAKAWLLGPFCENKPFLPVFSPKNGRARNSASTESLPLACQSSRKLVANRCGAFAAENFIGSG